MFTIFEKCLQKNYHTFELNIKILYLKIYLYSPGKGAHILPPGRGANLSEEMELRQAFAEAGDEVDAHYLQ